MTETEPLPFRHPLRPAELASRKPTRFSLSPAPEALAAIAEWAGIEALESLSLSGTLTPQGRADWLLQAEFSARVVQACVLTLAPVTTDLREPVTRRYLAEMPEPEGDEVEIPDDVSAEPLPDVIDLGAVALEVLELALPLYPRAPEVDRRAELQSFEAVPPGAAPIAPEATRPFAGLADLLQARKAGEGEDGGGEGGA